MKENLLQKDILDQTWDYQEQDLTLQGTALSNPSDREDEFFFHELSGYISRD